MPRLRTLTPSASPGHFFGSEVRRAREAAGMSQTELGDLVPCDKATVSRIEAGLTQPDDAFARACDAAFPRLDGWFTRFHAGSRTWGEAFPPAFRPFAACEAEAVALRWFEHSLVPGLLQTEDYARAVLEAHPNTTKAQVDDRLSARMARQAVLLAVQGEVPGVLAVLLGVLGGVDEHAAAARAGVVDAHACSRLDQANHHADDVPRCVELACLAAGGVGELGDQVLVGGAEQVGELEVLVPQAVAVEVADELLELGIREGGLADLAAEVDVLEDAGQRRGIVSAAPNRCRSSCGSVSLATWPCSPSVSAGS